MAFNCFDQVSFCLLVNSDEVSVISLANILVPKVQSENPIVANPACVFPLNSLNLPSATFRYLSFVVKNSSDRQVFDISFQSCILLVDKRLYSTSVSILSKLVVLGSTMVFNFVLSQSKGSW